jgi:hypothetical protein
LKNIIANEISTLIVKHKILIFGLKTKISLDGKTQGKGSSWTQKIIDAIKTN